ncbi:type I-F CRISPR-associated endoribonuclease Cas6/Csy4 [Serratia sp. UGAL515B_01]|uniref:type I-F CRISPR-associated endoribonuclease Cas6/Csy4 n=1 Tax=Serratia sp. UGAL515B_01 TaxID=2986763 RepID=UPI002952FF1B|nr:type I-F CRISPR-associated endoribonuclease Cas6/Csy4 [Serratia sp. UGAL515B_01]WON78428.1 type I-F CRISPR-associated endoribonuclease Cas6/Csy4 [Serratia sp. UGAL515B_01]
MDHYIEIRILPDPEFSTTTLMEALFAKLHRALGQVAGGQIGVSFPAAGKTLGDKLRLHGSLDALRALDTQPWLKGLRDNTEHSGILPVPKRVQYRTVRRVQLKSNAERLRRRSVNKGWLTEEEARMRIPDTAEKRSSLPFIRMRSLSSEQTFLLFIEQGQIGEHATEGMFNAYGLSATATIPWF